MEGSSSIHQALAASNRVKEQVTSNLDAVRDRGNQVDKAVSDRGKQLHKLGDKVAQVEGEHDEISSEIHSIIKGEENKYGFVAFLKRIFAALFYPIVFIGKLLGSIFHSKSTKSPVSETATHRENVTKGILKTSPAHPTSAADLDNNVSKKTVSFQLPSDEKVPMHDKPYREMAKSIPPRR